MLKKFTVLTALLTFAGVAVHAEQLVAEGIDAKGLPNGWQSYGEGPGIVKVEKGLVQITDQSDVNEWGIKKLIPIPQAGKYDFTLDGACTAAGGQMVAVASIPGQKNKVIGIKQVPVTGSADKFVKTTLTVDAPEGCTKIYFHIYSQYKPKADFVIRGIEFAPAK